MGYHVEILQVQNTLPYKYRINLCRHFTYSFASAVPKSPKLSYQAEWSTASQDEIPAKRGKIDSANGQEPNLDKYILEIEDKNDYVFN